MTIIKKIIFIAAIIALLSCEKRHETLEEYLPKVELISVEKTDSEKILAKGKILSAVEEITYLGFCADTVPNPEIDANQVVTFKINNNEFAAEIGHTFFPGTYSQLYINAFATNDIGYSTGSPQLITDIENIGIRPDVTVPCQLDVNTIKLTNNSSTISYSNISEVTQTGDLYSFTATINSQNKLIFTFSELDQRIYKTTDTSHSIDSEKMLVQVIQNGNYNLVHSGMDIFVLHVEGRQYEINICDGPWGFNSYLKTRLRVEK